MALLNLNSLSNYPMSKDEKESVIRSVHFRSGKTEFLQNGTSSIAAISTTSAIFETARDVEAPATLSWIIE